MTMMSGTQRRPFRPWRYNAILFLILISLLLDLYVIAQENESEIQEKLDEPSRDAFPVENGLFVLSQGKFAWL